MSEEDEEFDYARALASIQEGGEDDDADMPVVADHQSALAALIQAPADAETSVPVATAPEEKPLIPLLPPRLIRATSCPLPVADPSAVPLASPASILPTGFNISSRSRSISLGRPGASSLTLPKQRRGSANDVTSSVSSASDSAHALPAMVAPSQSASGDDAKLSPKQHMALKAAVQKGIHTSFGRKLILTLLDRVKFQAVSLYNSLSYLISSGILHSSSDYVLLVLPLLISAWYFYHFYSEMSNDVVKWQVRVCQWLTGGE